MLRALPLLALFLIVGCDGQDSLLGEFVGTDSVSGSAFREIEGEAVYTVVETADGPEIVLGLFVGDRFESDRDEYDYVLFRLPGRRPAVGAVVIDGDPGPRAAQATIARVEDADDVLDADGVLLAGTDGTLAISSVDGYGFVGGSYQVRAEGLRISGTRTSRVGGFAEGTFEATYVEPGAFHRLGLDL